MTREFARLARKERISDAALQSVVNRTRRGLIDAEIGKFLVKQHVGKAGAHRAILFYRDGDKLVFLHLFAKNVQANLTRVETEAYKELAGVLAHLTTADIERLVEQRKWIEVDGKGSGKASE